MNRVKKAIKNLHDYLGRDANGLRLLDVVTEAANDQRKENAELSQASDSNLRLARQYKKDLDDEQIEIKKIKEDLQTEKARASSLAGREKRLAMDLAQLRIEEEPGAGAGGRGSLSRSKGPVKTMERTMELMREVRKRYRHLPTPAFPMKAMVSLAGDDRNVLSYELETLVANHAFNEYASLGMVVSLMAYMNMPCVVQTRNLVQHSPNYDRDAYEEAMGSKFLSWLRRSVEGGRRGDPVKSMKSIRRTNIKERLGKLIASIEEDDRDDFQLNLTETMEELKAMAS